MNIKEDYFDLKIFDILFNNYPEGVVCKDKNLVYKAANNAYYRLFSNPVQLDGKSSNPAFSEKTMKLIHDADRQVMQSLTPLNYVLNTCENRLLNITSAPIVEEGKFFGIISVVKDITQEETLKESFVNKHFKYLDAEKKLQAQRETFVASIGHDLKNPTIAQIRTLELLLKGVFGELSEEQKELIEMLLDSCRYMHGMLSSLLATYRNCNGAVKLNFEEFEFDKLLEECVSEMVYVARDKNITLRIIKQADNCLIDADRVQIKRVIMNLLTNGIKYAFKDTCLELFIKSFENKINFEFHNQSPYIPESRQKSIFAKYVSFTDPNKELGIGLGLYASKKIIESHCGTIYVESFPENKNIFGFHIPLNQNTNNTKEIVF